MHIMHKDLRSQDKKKIVPARNRRAPAQHLIAPLLLAASERHTGQKRNEKGSAQISDPSNLAGPDFHVPENQMFKKL